MFTSPPSSDPASTGKTTATAAKWNQPKLHVGFNCIKHHAEFSLRTNERTSAAPVERGGPITMGRGICSWWMPPPPLFCPPSPPFHDPNPKPLPNRTTNHSRVPSFLRRFLLSTTTSKTKPLSDGRALQATKRTIQWGVFKPVRSTIGSYAAARTTQKKPRSIDSRIAWGTTSLPSFWRAPYTEKKHEQKRKT